MTFQRRAEAETQDREQQLARRLPSGTPTPSLGSPFYVDLPCGVRIPLEHRNSVRLPTGPRRPSLEGQTLTTGPWPGRAPVTWPPQSPL